ncbi:hypothetical protein PF003_g3622 [Phytophthora fragariae]|nr:hypothetical protein PF003_g3622 [Phytophthora fragariae]
MSPVRHASLSAWKRMSTAFCEPELPSRLIRWMIIYLQDELERVRVRQNLGRKELDPFGLLEGVIRGDKIGREARQRHHGLYRRTPVPGAIEQDRHVS